MAKNLIPAHSKNELREKFKIELSTNSYLSISEFFCDTIQGEGVSIGYPAVFLRLKGCILNCVWCDTADIWKNGDVYSFDHLLQLLNDHSIIEKFKNNHRLVVTGGSPLKQQESLIMFFFFLKKQIGFIPYIEVENECVIRIKDELKNFIGQWNNSPKLSNSGMKEYIRYNEDVIRDTARLKNSWFKFVVSDFRDWEEIEQKFLNKNLIDKSQLILMPRAENKKELDSLRKMVLDIAIKNGVKFSDRLHITIFDKKIGV